MKIDIDMAGANKPNPRGGCGCLLALLAILVLLSMVVCAGRV
jgi:hypothetical protein